MKPLSSMIYRSSMFACAFSAGIIVAGCQRANPPAASKVSPASLEEIYRLVENGDAKSLLKLLPEDEVKEYQLTEDRLRAVLNLYKDSVKGASFDPLEIKVDSSGIVSGQQIITLTSGSKTVLGLSINPRFNQEPEYNLVTSIIYCAASAVATSPETKMFRSGLDYRKRVANGFEKLIPRLREIDINQICNPRCQSLFEELSIMQNRVKKLEKG